MHIVGRIKLPKSAEVAKLYLQCSDKTTINYNAETPEVVLARQGVISTNSYFNSLYEIFYAKYTTLDRIFYLLTLEGDFQVSVYKEFSENSDRDLISQEKFFNCQLNQTVKVQLPLQQQQVTKGRIYFELECLSDRGRFQESLLVTPQPPEREVSLAVVACTFKKEAFVKRTVKAIAQDKLLQDRSMQVFVVDNGRTLDKTDFSDAARTKLITQRNIGGSGGFSRGIVEALSSNRYSHILLLDDDIELESESIYRVIALNEYAKGDLAIAGSMLDLYKKHILYEAGAAYDKDPQTFEFAPLRVAPLKHNLKLQETDSLNSLLAEDDVDYGGFWFFALPTQFVQKLGFLLPFFIKIDDMEFGLRIIKRLGKKIVAFPSIGVWHEPFYSKVIVWDGYYYTRNNLIARTIYGTIEYTNTAIKFTKDLIHALLIFEYNYAEMLVRGFEDYIQGPKILKNNSPEELHKEIVQLSKSYKTQVLQPNHYLDKQVNSPVANAKLSQKLASLLTLNGHLLPNFIQSNGEVLLWQNSAHAGTISRAFRKKKVIIYRKENSCLFQNELDKTIGINLVSRWLKAIAKSSIRWSAIKTEWKKAATELTSKDFWQQYLNLEKSN